MMPAIAAVGPRNGRVQIHEMAYIGDQVLRQHTFFSS
jgi:hypothetical protein